MFEPQVVLFPVLACTSRNTCCLGERCVMRKSWLPRGLDPEGFPAVLTGKGERSVEVQGEVRRFKPRFMFRVILATHNYYFYIIYCNLELAVFLY